MRRLLAALAAISGLCILWRYHSPRATILGGFRCEDCGRVGWSLDDFVPGGGAGYVTPGRPILDRDRRTITRDNAP